MIRFQPPYYVPLSLLSVLFCLTGCQSPYHADRGALFGGLLGAGTGAVVGHALGNTGAGAAIGAGVGALSGAAVGSGMDEVEAKNRAMIAAQMGRQVAPGAVTIPDVVAMAQNRVDEQLIINHIRSHGMVAPLQANDLIWLKQQGISERVVAAMQESPPRPVAAPAPYPGAVVYPAAPPPVIVQEYWGPPYHHGYYHRYRPYRPGVSWGMSFSN